MRWLGPAMLGVAIAAAALGCGARTELSLASSGEAPRPAVPEACNGLDDDGDGLVDEDVPPRTCGAGECRREAPGCADGQVPSCTPGEPAPEACNGLDDDCDGAVDEGLGFGPVAGPFVVELVPEYAFSNDLVVTPDGMLATWRDGFDGSAPTPNTFVRRLSVDGLPGPPTQTIFDRSVTHGPRVAPSVDGAFVLTFCGRFGTDDRAASVSIDAHGAVIADHGERSPTGRSCGAVDPDGVWTGSRHLFAWTDNSSGPVPGFEVLLDAADAGGASVSSITVHDEGDLYAPPRFAVAPDRVVMVNAFREEPAVSELAVHVLDLAGVEMTEPQVLAYPIPEGLWNEAAVALGGAGFLVVAPNRFSPGTVRVRLAPTGEVVEPPALVAGLEGTVSWIDMAARPAGGYVLAGNADGDAAYGGFVAAIDEAGEVTHLWTTDPSSDEPYLGFPAVAVRGQRVFVLYAAEATGTPELRIREFGCQP